MADSPPYRDTDDDTGVGSARGSTTGTPRWVKVFGIIALVLVLLVGVMLLIGGGDHGPARHTSSGDGGGQAPPSSVTESGGGGGHKPPAGGHTP
ncbi:MAG: hypothetical protein LC808_28515 [Actinobacteria bacterium]|nr:hypothetical protein [Actinomycetota bacterium]